MVFHFHHDIDIHLWKYFNFPTPTQAIFFLSFSHLFPSTMFLLSSVEDIDLFLTKFLVDAYSPIVFIKQSH